MVLSKGVLGNASRPFLAFFYSRLYATLHKCLRVGSFHQEDNKRSRNNIFQRLAVTAKKKKHRTARNQYRVRLMVKGTLYHLGIFFSVVVKVRYFLALTETSMQVKK